MAGKNCPHCNGTGVVIEKKGDAKVARPCKCRMADRTTKLRAQAGIPQRYQNRYVFEYYKPADQSQADALALAKGYAEDYPVFPKESINGLLFIGPCGVGKTHLAVSILQEILFRKSMPALFVDLNDLYREIRSSYGRPSAEETEYDILQPLVHSPLLLIDELGCVATPWAQDTLHYLMSQRYNEQLPTLCTTNYLDAPKAGESSLEDRIGTRTRSRLHEMCKTVVVDGADFRKRG